MARPVNADALATKQRILERASVLFADRGPEAVSVRDIAAASSVSLAMVHHYFGSKEELVRATVDAMYAELSQVRAELEATFVEGASLESVLHQAIDTGFDFARAHQLAVRTMMRTIVDTGELPEERRTEVMLPFLALVERVLALDGVSRHELRLRAQSIVFLVTRYALATLPELALIAGLEAPGTDPKKQARVLRAVKRHLAGLAVSALVATKESESCTKPQRSTAKRTRR